MLTKEEIERYKREQENGLPIGQKLRSIGDAAEMLGRTFKAVSDVKASRPGHNEKGAITWWIVGSQIMLNEVSLMKVALERGWVELKK